MADVLRKSGVFLPVFSLPGEYGIGTIGKSGKEFIDFLSNSGFSYWVVLPMGPTAFGNSPFSSLSSRALNHYFIDFDDLIEHGLLKKKDFTDIDWGDNSHDINYELVFKNKINILKIAFRRFKKTNNDYLRGYTTFLRTNRFLDYACFMVLKDINNGAPWNKFEGVYKEFSSEHFTKFKHEHKEEVEFYIWTQYIFLKQWNSLLAYAHCKGIKIIGNMPMHVSYDSIDVYKHHRNFMLTNTDEMKYVAGYPPDVFYSKGQCWGTPLYDFDYLKRSDYRLFKDRLEFHFELYDYVILDHFRGYLENYILPTGSENGLHGRWEKTDGEIVVDTFIQDKSKVIAEDVDYHSEEMDNILNKLKIKDQRVIEFAYPREKGNNNKPTNYTYNNISFSSTHDCLPLKGYLQSLNNNDLQIAIEQINKDCRHFGVQEVNKEDFDKQVEALLELNLASLSSISIQSMVDILKLPSKNRINTPSTVGKNWMFRLTKEDLSLANSKHLLALNKRYGRY